MKVLIPLAILLSASATGIMMIKGRAADKPVPAIVAARPASAEPHSLTPRLDKQQRAELLQRLAQAQQAAVATGSRRQEAAPAPPPELDKDYIRGQMQALIPLIKECYENALRDKPMLSGKLVVNFTIVAEPEIGGLVADSTVDPDNSDIADSDLRECVQETMYGARFPAPKDGGEVKVTYPFIFKTVDD